VSVLKKIRAAFLRTANFPTSVTTVTFSAKAQINHQPAPAEYARRFFGLFDE
jgi:hypothetical protein